MSSHHTEISPNGVAHIVVTATGWCATCGKDHRDWRPLPERLRPTQCWCGGALVITSTPEGALDHGCADSEFHDPLADGRPAKVEVLYVSGPMSGYPDCNYPLFREAAKALRRAGYTVVDPSECELPERGHYTDLLRQDLRNLLDCQGVAVLERWWESSGSRCEVDVAGIVRMPVRTVDEWLALRGM